MPTPDPIIEEIHAIREKIAHEGDLDIQKIAKKAKVRQELSGRRTVTRPAKRPKRVVQAS